LTTYAISLSFGLDDGQIINELLFNEKIINGQIDSGKGLMGRYEAAAARADDVDRPYRELASMLHCDPEEIAIVASATSAWQQAFFGLQFDRGDRIITRLSTVMMANYTRICMIICEALWDFRRRWRPCCCSHYNLP
jgi:hypothetical protein